MAEIVLNGITWNHSRGLMPLLAASQRFHELNPHIQINWTKRTLQQFADFPIEKLTHAYDLLIIDYPWSGCAAATNCVLPLDKYLTEEFLQNQLENTVGGSHLSYNYNKHQWALAIDAATPAASYRKDIFEKNNQSVPQTWDEVLSLAKENKVAVPAIPIDLLMNFYTFCIAEGKHPFASKQKVIDEETGLNALTAMKQFYSLVDKSMFTKNPIAVAEVMSNQDNYWYCPFAYCYSNYSRKGYSKNILHYSDVVLYNNKKLITTIGGTGLAVSAFSNYTKEAVQFAEFVLSPQCQSNLYVQNGGQPGHLKAWLNNDANYITNNFFKNVLPAMQSGYVRPRYNGYLHFQDNAGDYIHSYLKGENDNPEKVLIALNKLYQESFVTENLSVA
jgi:multiple sugar transport system substrate-binding protein